METMSLEKWWELRENTFKEILVEGEDCILTYDKLEDGKLKWKLENPSITSNLLN